MSFMLLLVVVGPFMLAFAAMAWLESLQPPPARRRYRKPQRRRNTTPEQDHEEWSRNSNAWHRDESPSYEEPAHIRHEREAAHWRSGHDD